MKENDSERTVAMRGALSDPDVELRRASAEYFAHFAVEAIDAAVALVAACGDEDEQVREWSTAALEELEPPPVEQATQLAKLSSHTNEDVSYWAATLLGRMKSDGAAGVPQLARLISSHPAITIRRRAAWALSKIGVGAASAKSALQLAAACEDARLAQLARTALDAISG